jgi:hypothetical protein
MTIRATVKALSLFASPKIRKWRGKPKYELRMRGPLNDRCDDESGKYERISFGNKIVGLDQQAAVSGAAP